MAKNKYDGVVEAVRYNPEGQVAWVRAYMRNGPIFSDHLLINRTDLVAFLKSGKKFVVGKRIPYMASTFEVPDPQKILSTDGKVILMSGEKQADRDFLQGVPVV